MELFDQDDYRLRGASRLLPGQTIDEADSRRRLPVRDTSRLDHLYRLKLAGRDPERLKRRRRSLHEIACWIAVALLTAAALASPVRAADASARSECGIVIPARHEHGDAIAVQFRVDRSQPTLRRQHLRARPEAA